MIPILCHHRDIVSPPYGMRWPICGCCRGLASHGPVSRHLRPASSTLQGSETHWGLHPQTPTVFFISFATVYASPSPIALCLALALSLPPPFHASCHHLRLNRLTPIKFLLRVFGFSRSRPLLSFPFLHFELTNGGLTTYAPALLLKSSPLLHFWGWRIINTLLEKTLRQLRATARHDS